MKTPEEWLDEIDAGGSAEAHEVIRDAQAEAVEAFREAAAKRIQGYRYSKADPSLGPSWDMRSAVRAIRALPWPLEAPDA